MKRYFAFYGSTFYPNEAMEDFIGDFSTLDKCLSIIKLKNIEQDDCSYHYSWALIYDTKIRQYVYVYGNCSVEIKEL